MSDGDDSEDCADTAIIGDPSKAAIAPIRGYLYQFYTTAIAWLNLKPNETLLVEVAEDFSVADNTELSAVQVKDTRATGNITLNTDSVLDTIESFITLQEINSARIVRVKFLTTSDIGVEKRVSDRVRGGAALVAWNNPEDGDSVVLRDLLLRDNVPEKIRKFVAGLEDEKISDELIDRISWDCGQPDISEIQREYNEELQRFCSSSHGLSEEDSLRISADVINYIIELIVYSEERILTTAKLKKLISIWSEIHVPKMLFDKYMGEFGLVNAGRSSSLAVLPRVSFPLVYKQPTTFAPREKILVEISRMVDQTGYCLMQGGVLVGKSTMAKAYAIATNRNWLYADLTSSSSELVSEKIIRLHSECMEADCDGVIIDGVDFFEDANTTSVCSALFGFLLSKKIQFIVISAAQISVGTVRKLNLDSAVMLTVPYLTDEDVLGMISSVCKDPEHWLSTIYVMSGGRQPLLVTSVIEQLERAQWDSDKLKEEDTPLHSGLEAEKTAARRSMAVTLDPDECEFINRLSVVSYPFERELAVDIAEIDPKVPNPSNAIDKHIGRWLELNSESKLSVTPLLSSTAVNSLSNSALVAVNEAIANHYIETGMLDVSIVERLILHGIRGRAEFALVSYAMKVSNSSKEDLELLSTWMPAVRSFSFDRPMYANNLVVALPLRLMQFELLVAHKEKSKALKCWETLVSELSMDEHESTREKFEIGMLIKALSVNVGHLGLSSPLTMFDRLLKLLQKNEEAMAERGVQADIPDVIGTLFLGQVATSDKRYLSDLLNELSDGYSQDVKEMLFSMFRHQEYRYIVDTLSQGETASKDKILMTEIQALSDKLNVDGFTLAFELTCIEKEFAESGDTQKSLKALGQVKERFGDQTGIVLSKLDILMGSREYFDAFTLATHLEADDTCDGLTRIVVNREAAVSAANLGLWPESIKYFQQAMRSSEKGNEDIDAYLLGLQGDLSLALHESGDVSGALEGMADLLAKLEELPAETVQCRYVHLIVRHVVLWMHGESMGSPSIAEDGHPYTIYVGICSNPNPHPGLASRQIPHLAIAGYYLSNAEIQACGEWSIATELREKLGEVCLPQLELMQTFRKMELYIERSDIDNLLGSLKYYLALHKSTQTNPMSDMDLVSPRFKPLPQPVATTADLDESVWFHLDDVLCACLIKFSLQGVPVKFDEVLNAVNRMFDIEIAGLTDNKPQLELLVEGRLHKMYPYIRTVLATARLDSESLFAVTYSLYNFCLASAFKTTLCPILCAWIKEQWEYQFTNCRAGLTNQNLNINSRVVKSDI